MANLPVREMVLYKHGVGFFVREGDLAGEQVQLTFRSDEINDVLKSLAVFDHAGGVVLGIHYQTPMDTLARLASSSIRLSHVASVRDLIRDLRGRQCELTFATTPEIVQGRMIGLDETHKEDEDALVSILTSIEIRVFPLKTLRTIRIVDDLSSHDLAYFLDTSMAEDDRRVINVRLSPGQHQLAIYYVAPSPTWRVSYRLVAESSEDIGTGEALLQGWGLFDNRLDEDLDDVRVTLVAGQPISFIYDLYASRIPERPHVQDESRIAPGPIEFAGMAVPSAHAEIQLMEDATMSFEAPPAPMPAAMAMRGAPAAKPMTRSAVAASTPPQAEVRATGETFQYTVTAPVSVKRGESALVPIIGQTIKYELELLYNGAKFASRPVAALRFDNSTSLTLERGPVTVVIDGEYRGEAVIPFTKEDQQVYVPYAVELGILVTERRTSESVYSGINLDKNYISEQYYFIDRTTYIVENTTTKSCVVTIESAINTNWELHDTRLPDHESAQERRWKVQIPAKGRAEFVRQERQLRSNHVSVFNLSYQRLQEYLENRWIDVALHGQLGEILDILAQKQKAEKSIKLFEDELASLYAQQEQIRANLGSLQHSGQEAALRTRMLRQLETSQDRLETINSKVAEAIAFVEEADKRVLDKIAALGR